MRIRLSPRSSAAKTRDDLQTPVVQPKVAKTRKGRGTGEEVIMWLLIGILLVIVWVFSFVVFKVTSWALHLLILFAILAAIMQLVRWFRTRNTKL
jgi:hypothetical protein